MQTQVEAKREIVFPALLVLVIATILMALLFLFFTQMLEQYFPLYPSIDTTFAPRYSEKGFDAIQVGMQKADVERLVGPPLTKDVGPAGFETWNYSADNAFKWWDFAWLSREVDFNGHGEVTMVRKSVVED